MQFHFQFQLWTTLLSSLFDHFVIMAPFYSNLKTKLKTSIRAWSLKLTNQIVPFLYESSVLRTVQGLMIVHSIPIPSLNHVNHCIIKGCLLITQSAKYYYMFLHQTNYWHSLIWFDCSLLDCFSIDYVFFFSVNFISMKLSFSVSGLVYGLVVRERVWDYALTITVFHTALSCLGELSALCTTYTFFSALFWQTEFMIGT